MANTASLAADVWNAQVTVSVLTVFRVTDVLFLYIMLRDWFVNAKDVVDLASAARTGWWAVQELGGQDFWAAAGMLARVWGPRYTMETKPLSSKMETTSLCG